MSELEPCPFCGGGQYSHEDWCFILMCLVNEEQAMFGNKRLFTEEDLTNAWNTRAERTCHMTLKKSGPFYDVWHFDCCEKEWAEPRCDNGVVDYPGIVCPYCGTKVVE